MALHLNERNGDAQPAVYHPPATESYGPGVLRVEFEPADLWAYTILKNKALPPVEFDHRFGGSVTIINAGSQEQAKEICHMPEQDMDVVGCSGFPPGGLRENCIVVLGDAETIRAHGWTRNIVLRHELRERDEGAECTFDNELWSCPITFYAHAAGAAAVIRVVDHAVDYGDKVLSDLYN